MTTPKKGLTFTHNYFLDPEDRKLPAKEARKAVMAITRVGKLKVWYTYARDFERGLTRSHWYMPRPYWEETYGANT